MDDVQESRTTDSARDKYKDKRDKTQKPARDSDHFDYVDYLVKDLTNV